MGPVQAITAAAPLLEVLQADFGQGGGTGLDTFPGPLRVVTNPSQFAALGAGVLACLLLLLFIYRRRSYILYWTCSWTLLAGSLLLASYGFENDPTARVLVGFSQVLSIAAAMVVLLSASTFRHPDGALSPKLLLTLLPLVIWFGLAPLALSMRSVLVPGYLISSGMLGLGAVAFLNLLRKYRMMGAALVGVSLLVLAASHAWIAISIVRMPFSKELPLGALTLNAMLYLVEALGMHLLVAEDMTYELRVANRQLSAAQAELHALAVTDELTGCYNRRHFQQIIIRELKRHHRYGIPLSLLFIDIDRFKEVNDQHGHDTGDQVLQLVAHLLIGQVRDIDYVFRWGGDEFVILVSCNREHARRKASEIKAEFTRLTAQMGLPSGVALSVGCGEASGDLNDPFALVQAADEEMYRDKLESRSVDHATEGREGAVV